MLQESSAAAPSSEFNHAIWLPLVLGLLAFYSVTVFCVATYFLCFFRSFGEEQPLRGRQPIVPKQSASLETVQVTRDRSWWDHKGPTPEYSPQIKLDFLKKVYGLLSTQIALCLATCALFVFASFQNADPHKLTSFGEGFIARWWLVYVLLIPTFITLFVAIMQKNTYPLNMTMLFSFTLCESVTVAFIVVLYWGAGMGDIVFVAVGITLFIFCVLTIYTLVSKADFSFCAPFLFVSLAVLIVWGVVLRICFIFGGYNADAYMWYSLVGALLFSAFIIFDTWKIANILGPDDYIIACIELYLDIINLFLYILSILGNRR